MAEKREYRRKSATVHWEPVLHWKSDFQCPYCMRQYCGLPISNKVKAMGCVCGKEIMLKHKRFHGILRIELEQEAR